MARKEARNAGILLSRFARACLVRARLVKDYLQLARSSTRIFFPEEFAWEFLILVNVVRQQLQLQPLPAWHAFDPCDLLAVRMPESSDMPGRHSVMTKLLSIR